MEINSSINNTQSLFKNNKSYIEKLFEGTSEDKDEQECEKDIMKAMEIARRIMHGDKVPRKDEKYLMETDAQMYAKAKLLAVKNSHPKKYKSLVEEDEKSSETQESVIYNADAESTTASDTKSSISVTV